MSYVHLAIAILAEVIATTFLKQADGFTRLLPTSASAIGYVIAFYFLSLALRHVSTGVAYAIWSGVGIILITAAAWLFHGQRQDTAALAGMALIIAGVIVMNLFSATASH